MLKDACRVYPIICNDGTIVPVAFDPNNWVTTCSEIIWNDKKEEPTGNYYYNDKNSLRYYGIGFKDIPQDVNLPVRGLPMFNDLPFEEIKAFAKPRLMFLSTEIGKGSNLGQLEINCRSKHGYIKIVGKMGPIKGTDVEISYGGFSYPIAPYTLAQESGFVKMLNQTTDFRVSVKSSAAATVRIYVEWCRDDLAPTKEEHGNSRI